MNSSRKARIYSIVAGVCFLLYAVVTFVTLLNLARYYIDNLMFSSYIFLLARVLVIFVFCVLSFIGKRSIVLVVVSGSYVLMHLYLVIRDASLTNIIYLAAVTVLLVIILLGTMPSLKPRAQINKLLWCIPATLLLVRLTIILFMGRFFDWDDTIFMINTFLYWLLEPTAFLFLGMWFREEVDAKNIKHTASIASNQASNSVVGADTLKTYADTLKTYKELLDSGVITQEEFESKKKQILSLS